MQNTDTESTSCKIRFGIFLLLFFCLTYVHQKKFGSPTPVSRLDLLHAILTHGGVSIDAYAENTPDKALYRGVYYSDKAPGMVTLALPSFAFASALFSLAGIGLDSKAGWLYSSWIACAGSIAVVAALGGVALFTWLADYVPPRIAFATTLAIFLGSAPLPYSTMMFSHAMVIGAIAISLRAIQKQEIVQCTGLPVRIVHEGWQGMVYWIKLKRWYLLAGFCAGWALASEFSSGFVIMGLAIWVFTSGPNHAQAQKLLATGSWRRGGWILRRKARFASAWTRGIPFCLAAVPPLLLIPGYSWVCFHDPFTLPYSHQASFPAMREGLYAICWPNAETSLQLLFSPARGLFFWSPFFLMAVFGYTQLIRERRELFWLTYAVPLLQVLVISGRVWDWPAGPAWGPRLLSPMIPLLALPCSLGVHRFPRIGYTLVAYSVLVTVLATLTDACPPFNAYPDPLLDLNLRLFLKGRFSPNLGMMLGLPPYPSVALYFVVLTFSSSWLWRRIPRTRLPDQLNHRHCR